MDYKYIYKDFCMFVLKVKISEKEQSQTKVCLWNQIMKIDYKYIYKDSTRLCFRLKYSRNSKVKQKYACGIKQLTKSDKLKILIFEYS